MQRKKIVLAILLTIASFIADAQLEESDVSEWTTIGRLKFGGITKARLQYTANGRDTVYMLFIKDVREQPKSHYFSISFKNIDGTFERLYTILKSFFLPGNKKNRNYSRTFNLGNTAVSVQHYLLITGKGIQFTTNDGYTYWSEKDIDKLFGKR